MYNCDALMHCKGTWIEYGSGIEHDKYDYKMGNEIICRREEKKDLGVTVSENMSPDKHIKKITGQT